MQINNNFLGIFCKNPIPGRVKIEIEKETDAAFATDVYLKLQKKANLVAKAVPNTDVGVFYFDYLQKDDVFEDQYARFLQIGHTLDQRIENCFELGFDKGYERIVLIRVDCPLLNAKLIEEAFQQLLTKKVVFGPETDKGFYLFGMNKMIRSLFGHDKWCEDEFVLDFISFLNESRISYHVLPALKAVHTLADWKFQTIYIN